jgi:hypothetical protein
MMREGVNEQLVAPEVFVECTRYAVTCGQTRRSVFSVDQTRQTTLKLGAGRLDVGKWVCSGTSMVPALGHFTHIGPTGLSALHILPATDIIEFLAGNA